MAKEFISITGDKVLMAKLRLYPEKAIHGASVGMSKAFNQVMTRSKEEFCPVDTGTLRATGNVLLPEMKGSKLEIVMGYGDAACKYAISVHEINKNYRGGKQWKYLETPLKDALPEIGRVIGEELAKALKDV